MENGIKGVRDFFPSRTIFNIPIYQRAYSWEGKHWDDFLDDIDNHAIGNNYFLGTILLQEGANNGSIFKIMDIVDGQQRITTLVIFMKVLIDQLREKGKNEDLDILEETYVRYKGEYKLRVLQDDNEYFHTYILGEIQNVGKDFARTPSQKRLYSCKKHFIEVLSVTSPDNLLSYKVKVDEWFQVLSYTVKSAVEATLIFETTNDRGKGLTNLEKLKSFLMHKCFIAQKEAPDTLLAEIQSRFSSIYTEFDKISSLIHEDQILQYHFIANEKWSDKSEYQQLVDTFKTRLNQLIKEKRHTEAINNIKHFTKGLKETYMTACKILQSKDKAIRDLFFLDRVGNFWPLLVKTYGIDQSENKQAWTNICRLLGVYSFRVYSTLSKRSNTGQSALFIKARDFLGDFNDLERQIRFLILLHGPDKEFLQHLARPKLYEVMGKNDLKYLFWKYENYLRAQKQPKWPELAEDEIATTESGFNFTIEHIAPQNPLESKVIEDTSILQEYTEEFRELSLHSIGNLTIDPQSSNSSKGRKDFEIKNSKYFIKAPLKTQNELEDFLPDSKKWGKDAIVKRSKAILDFARNYWNHENIEAGNGKEG